MSDDNARGRITRRRFLAAAAASAPALALGSRPVRAQSSVELRIATTWPAGSSVARQLTAWGATLARRTDNQVRLRLYFGGSQGDEREAVRKTRVGLVEGVLLTSSGASQFSASTAALEAPGVCTTYTKLDTARVALTPTFEAAFATGGVKLLGFYDYGARRVFSRRPIVTPEDMRSTRMASPAEWEQWRSIAIAASVPRVQCSVPEVAPWLTTGQIDAFPATSLEAVANGWQNSATHVTSSSHGLMIGATVLSRAAFVALSSDHQRVLLETAAQAHTAMRAAVRRDDEVALTANLRRGAMRVDTAPAEAAWSQVFLAARTSSVGRLFSAELLAQVEQHAATVA